MLSDEFERYIALRRSMGAGLERSRQYLLSYARFAEGRGEHHIRAQTALEWARTAPTPRARYEWLSRLALAARFLRAEDAAHEVPPAHLFAIPRTRSIPYIYTPEELVRILDAAGEITWRKRSVLYRKVYVMLFGLIAATGLRVSEALDLRLDDVLRGGILRIRKAKYGKSRLVPLHSSVREALDTYLVSRRTVAAESDHLFLSAKGNTLTYPTVNQAFHNVLRRANIAPERCKLPRIHDLRHTFATRVLEQGKADRRSIARRTVALMTYMGHENPRYTYWYLQATPELMADIAAAAETLIAGQETWSGAAATGVRKEVRQ